MTHASTRASSAVAFLSVLAVGLGGAAHASTLRTADEIPQPPTCAGVAATKTSGARHIWGTRGDDVIVVTGVGRHVVHARGGNDLVCGSDGVDIVLGGAGNDRLFGGAGNDRLRGGRGDDEILGGDGHDREFGGAGDDRLRGGPGTDVLRGGDGDDDLDGEEGADRCFGGRGDDRVDVDQDARDDVTEDSTDGPHGPDAPDLESEHGDQDTGPDQDADEVQTEEA